MQFIRLLSGSTHIHNHNTYVPLTNWVEEFSVDVGSSSSSKGQSFYADLKNPFDYICEVAIANYDIPYNCVGKEYIYSEELFLAATIVHWLWSIFPLNKTNEVRPETFAMTICMAKGERIAIGVSSLAFIYDRLDAVFDGKSAPYAKTFTLPITFLSGWLSCYCPETYSQRRACPP